MEAKLRKGEVIFVLMIVLIAVAVSARYYMPELVPKYVDRSVNVAEANAKFALYRAEMRKHPELYVHPVSQKEAAAVPVLVYHGIPDEPYKNDVYLKNFKDQMFRLKQEGYRTITLQDFYDFMRGERVLPEKSILLTFDDGVKSSYYNVDPILRALDYNAVMFVITKYSLNGTKIHPYYLNEMEVKEMLASGRWEVQPHAQQAHSPMVVDASGTLGNFFANKKWIAEERRLETVEEYQARVRQELRGAKEDVERKLGVDAYVFSFPLGDIGEESLNFQESTRYLVDEARPLYKLVNYQYWSGRGFSYNYPEDKPFFVKRITVTDWWDGQELLWALGKGENKNLPFYDDFRFNRGWVKVWGDVEIKDKVMHLNPDVTYPMSGVAAFLDGTHLWKDYAFKVQVRGRIENMIGLRARYVNQANAVGCDFGENFVRVSEIVGNKATVLNARSEGLNMPRENAQIGIRVIGQNVECMVGNVTVLNARIQNKDAVQGGVGIRSYGKAPMSVQKVTVESAG